jgi:hypothetical protein
MPLTRFMSDHSPPLGVNVAENIAGEKNEGVAL